MKINIYKSEKAWKRKRNNRPDRPKIKNEVVEMIQQWVDEISIIGFLIKFLAQDFVNRIQKKKNQ